MSSTNLLERNQLAMSVWVWWPMHLCLRVVVVVVVVKVRVLRGWILLCLNDELGRHIWILVNVHDLKPSDRTALSDLMVFPTPPHLHGYVLLFSKPAIISFVFSCDACAYFTSIKQAVIIELRIFVHQSHFVGILLSQSVMKMIIKYSESNINTNQIFFFCVRI